MVGFESDSLRDGELGWEIDDTCQGLYTML